MATVTITAIVCKQQNLENEYRFDHRATISSISTKIE